MSELKRASDTSMEELSTVDLSLFAFINLSWKLFYGRVSELKQMNLEIETSLNELLYDDLSLFAFINLSWKMI